jgi:phosphatidylglycerol:prolipoprotein diacylglycerol transferase
MIALGVAAGVLVAWRFPVKKGVPRQDVLFACCYAGIGAILGAKLLYLAVTIPQFLTMPNPPVFSWGLVAALIQGGFVFYGGVLGGLLGIWIYCRAYKLNFLATTESIIPSVPLAHAFGRVGCFCAGCCYGIPAAPPWGVVFRPDSVAIPGVPLFPVQLLESLVNLILFGILFVYSRKDRPAGHILGFYVSFYAVERFLLEFLRYDTVRGAWLGISTSQWISLALLPAGIFLFFLPKLMKKRTE